MRKIRRNCGKQVQAIVNLKVYSVEFLVNLVNGL